jgi:excinuclease ABC subunit A
MFSFNSASGACPTCRGFGRVIGVDWGLVIPDGKEDITRWCCQTHPDTRLDRLPERLDQVRRRCRCAARHRLGPIEPEHKKWVIDGDPNWKGSWTVQWYGLKRFFEYLESKAYKMHIRVLLSKYRSYTPCPTCEGARLQLESLLWRLGSQQDADAVLPPAKRFKHHRRHPATYQAGSPARLEPARRDAACPSRTCSAFSALSRCPAVGMTRPWLCCWTRSAPA